MFFATIRLDRTSSFAHESCPPAKEEDANAWYADSSRRSGSSLTFY